ncbi:MAG: nicotinate-nucleotide adenylyltransferase [Ignavibacteria bacterium]|jgi:nicotinate-nucleotide adenylyltransferase|nr:nicotinate-nucleotide adenylyltransferase [Ignavibacteria bacterium]
MKRYGILGGSFNPPHTAHLILAENVKEQLELDKVIFIPSGKHALKDPQSLAEAGHRLNMARIAFEQDSSFEVSDIEIRKAKAGLTNYTVDTLIDLYQMYQKDFIKIYLIVGIDNLIEFPQWKDPHKLFILSEVVVMNRPGYFIQDVSVEFSRKARYLSVPMLEISSSEIRNRVRDNKSIKYLVDPEVEKYIKENNLYK